MSAMPGAAASFARPTRMAKWGRRAMWTGCVLGAATVITEVATENSLSRSCRAVTAFIRMIAMYKFQTPETAEEYFQMHQRAADSILHVCLTNEGLYVKLGQGLNAMSHILPRQYTETLKVLLDNAKPVPMSQVRATIEDETGRRLEDVFERFDEEPVASASIAQVHKAWLKPNVSSRNEENANVNVGPIPVAVKVRKPCIGKQSKWDIYTFQLFSATVQYLFGLPTQWSRKTIVDGLKREMDFRIEVANAEQFRRNFCDDPHVYIPTVYHELSSERLIVMEWVDAAKLSETEKIRAIFNDKAVLKKLFDAFGDMVFKHGFVHCDPHAANVLVRHMPETAAGSSRDRQLPSSGNSSKSNSSQNEHLSTKNLPSSPSPSWLSSATQPAPGLRASRNDFQIVLLDFGLCVPETERFRMQYALLFRSLATRDMTSLRRVVEDWGISDPEIFAAMQMQKPLSSIREGNYGEVTKEEVRQMQREAHSRVKSFMIDEARIPRELPLVGRGVDILRGINRMYDSPINRVNMFVQSAVNALGPLHDFDSVQLYLRRIHKLVLEAQSRDSAAAAASPGRATTVAPPSSASPLPNADAAYSSVYDEGALKLRREQAAAVRELMTERNSTLTRRVYNDLASLYRAFLFHLIMFNLNLGHALTRWYNTLVRLLLPAETGNKLLAPSLEDRLQRAENFMRIE